MLSLGRDAVPSAPLTTFRVGGSDGWGQTSLPWGSSLLYRLGNLPLPAGEGRGEGERKITGRTRGIIKSLN